MLHVFLTNELYDVLTKAGTPMSENKKTHSWNWHAKIIKFGRTKYVLVVEEKTRYAVVMPDFKKKEFHNFHKLFIEHLAAHLFRLFCNHGEENINKIRDFLATLSESCSYSKPISRSVIAHMTQMNYEIEIFCHKDLNGYLPSNMDGLWKLNCYLNEGLRTIPKQKNYIVPVEEFKNHILELLDFEPIDNIINLDSFRK